MFITACGFIDKSGFGSNHSRSTWHSHNCPENHRLQWRTFFQKPFDRFGRLDLLAKYAAIAVEMLRIPVPDPQNSYPSWAIALGTQYGSYDVDLSFIRSIEQTGGPSPKLFSYTLPSTAIGEIAIRHRITGSNICLMAGAESGLLALWEAVRIVETAEAQCCICIDCDAIAHTTKPGPPSLQCNNGTPECFAYAFMIMNDKYQQLPSHPPLARCSIKHAPLADSPPSSLDIPRQTLKNLCDFLSLPESNSKKLSLPAPASLAAPKSLNIVRA